MVRVLKALAPLALVAGIAGLTALVADAQPPFGKGQFKGFPGKGDDKKGEKKIEDKKIEKVEGKKGEAKKGEGPKSDPVVDAWVAVLIAKITDPHDTVRDSARGALVNVGSPAFPALQKLADGDDPAKAVAARKVIAAIQGTRGAQTPAATPQRGMGGINLPGFPGFGRPGAPGGDRGPKRDRDEERSVEVAPMPRATNR